MSLIADTRALTFMRLVLSSCWLGVLSALVACAGAHDVSQRSLQPSAAGESALVAAAPASTLCTRLSQLQCEAEQRCCMQPGRALAECQTARQNDCVINGHLDALASDKAVGFDAAAADSFFTELQRKLEACDVDIVGWSASQSGLRSLFQGSVAQGQSCKPAQLLNADESQQAAALLSCRDATQVACMPQSLLGEWTCTPKSAAGGSCLSDDNCAQDAFCLTPAQAIFGTCQTRLATDAACSGNTQCQSFACVSGTCQPNSAEHAFCPQP